MAEEIGGYFARLRLVVAQDDFNQGMRSLILLDAQIKTTGNHTRTATDDWANFTVKLASSIYIIKEVASALKGLFDNVAKSNQATLTTTLAAYTLGMKPNELQTFQNAFGAIGISGPAARATASNLGLAMGAISSGDMSTEQAKYMGLLGGDISQERNKNGTEVATDLVNLALRQLAAGVSAATITDRLRKASLGGGLDQVFGFLADAKNRKLFGINNMSDFLRYFGKGSTYTTDKSMQQGSEGATALNAVNTTFGSQGQLFASTVGGDIAPALKDLFEYMIKNKSSISDAIKELAHDFAGVIELFIGLAKAFEWVATLFGKWTKFSDKMTKDTDIWNPAVTKKIGADMTTFFSNVGKWFKNNFSIEAVPSQLGAVTTQLMSVDIYGRNAFTSLSEKDQMTELEAAGIPAKEAYTIIHVYVDGIESPAKVIKGINKWYDTGSKN